MSIIFPKDVINIIAEKIAEKEKYESDMRKIISMINNIKNSANGDGWITTCAYPGCFAVQESRLVLVPKCGRHVIKRNSLNCIEIIDGRCRHSVCDKHGTFINRDTSEEHLDCMVCNISK